MNVDPSLIFDIGMNICEDTDYYLRKGFRVIAVEANPAACVDAQRRFAAEIAAGQLVVVNNAISPRPGRLVFYVCREMSAWSTTKPELRDMWMRQGATFEEIEVATITVGELLAKFGLPYFVKIDVEGEDTNVLAALAEAGAAPTHLSFEVDFKTSEEAFAHCRSLGYRSFSLVDQGKVPAQKPPSPATEGQYVAYEFRSGCSGLFGKELPPGWRSAAEVAGRCRSIVRQYRIAGVLRRVLRPFRRETLADTFCQRFFPDTRTWHDVHVSLHAHDVDGRLAFADQAPATAS